jgi:hypothetical protein
VCLTRCLCFWKAVRQPNSSIVLLHRKNSYSLKWAAGALRCRAALPRRAATPARTNILTPEKKKGPLGVTDRPKSREETPKEGNKTVAGLAGTYLTVRRTIGKRFLLHCRSPVTA